MSAPSTDTHEVQLAIYDLSMGMARGLSAQFLGPQHAVDIIPHTAIVAYGQEYFFGQGIEWCPPREFRATRGIQPIEIRSLGRTTRTRREFEGWCRDVGSNGEFGPASYDFFHRNCNNFSEEAAKRGLGLARGVPRYILDLPAKFLSSPMGMAVRPMLEQMQIANAAPTNVAPRQRPAFAPAGAPASSSAAAANPWAKIPAATATATATATPTAAPAPPAAKGTPLLDKQTALLSTDTGVVKLCLDRLQPEDEGVGKLLSKLSDAKAPWSREELASVHQYLRSVVTNNNQRASFALMLLRLVVLRLPAGDAVEPSKEEQSRSARFVANLLLEDELPSLAARSMAWCVLSNAAGSARPPSWRAPAEATDDDEPFELSSVIDAALRDADPTVDGASSPGRVSLRQSAAAFLYNAAIREDLNASSGTTVGDAELSDVVTSVLLGCLEHLPSEPDAATTTRLFMAVGRCLKSPAFGRTAASLANDLGVFDADAGAGKGREVAALAEEVASLLR